MELTKYLDDIEKRISPEIEDSIISEWLDFADGKCKKPIFSPKRPIIESKIEWENVLINDAFEDIDLMIYHQLKGISDELCSGRGNILNMRANYGTGIIPSMFGGKIFKLNDSANTLPSTMPLANGKKDVQQILSNHKIDYSKGLAPRVFEFAERLKELISDYPLISKYVCVYNPDLQGPFDLCDMLWGSEIYLEFYEDDTILNEFLDFMAETIIDFLKKWHAIFPPFDDEHSVEWGLLHKGGIIIRNDSIVNISGDQYEKWVLPYDQKVLNVFGGGIHFCGRGDHYIDRLATLDNMYCINLSQPELNDMEKIYSNTVDKGISIIGLPKKECVRALSNKRPLHGLVHSGASLATWKNMKKN